MTRPAAPNDPLRASVGELLAALDARQLSCVELVDAVYERIAHTQPTLNAFTNLRDRERALADARASDARRARGEARALEGLPLGVKDLEDAEGLPTTLGSRAFADAVAERDSTQVARLRAAGAIVVGKTNTPELGHTAVTKNPLFGATRNPWNLERTPGGSSGGASAAIAGGVVPIATASDGGGSVRIPASCTGCFGLKPTFGRIAQGPGELWNIDHTSVQGPLTRTVEDAARQLDATCGPDASDPFSLPAPERPFAASLDELRRAGRRLRFGFSPDLGYAVVQSDVADAVEEAALVFERLGHAIVPIAGGPPEPGREWSLLGAFEQRSKLAPWLPERREAFGRAYLEGVERGAERMTIERWHAYRVRRREIHDWCAALFEQVDLLLTPTIPYDPPPARGPLAAEVEGRAQPPANIGSFTMPFNLSLGPAASVRAGLSRAGLPVGMQIAGPRLADALVLQAAFAFERERPWHPHWPVERSDD
ncbi:MAG: amidase [Myxococcales bacterium]|nr:amidase [Myxococcales bacterium]